jgi:hypothetical protein
MAGTGSRQPGARGSQVRGIHGTPRGEIDEQIAWWTQKGVDKGFYDLKGRCH